MKLLVFGGMGQFSKSLIAVSNKENVEVSVVPSSVGDLRDYRALERVALNESPDVLINTGAVHAKDECEESPGRAYEVNSIGSKNVANLSRRLGLPCVYISTDFVFMGLNGKGNISEAQKPDARLDVYSETKLLGESYVLDLAHEPIVWRVSSPFGPFDSRAKGKNFLGRVSDKLKQGERVQVVNNIRMSPTFTLDSASSLCQVLKLGNPSGVWHGSNSGSASWFEFTVRAAELLGTRSPTAIYAEHSRDTSLNVEKLSLALGKKVRSWDDALVDYLGSG